MELVGPIQIMNLPTLEASQARGTHILGPASELGVIHVSDVTAEQHVVDLQPHLFADGTRNLLVVASQDLGGNAVIAQRLDRIGRRLFGRIQKGQVAD